MTRAEKLLDKAQTIWEDSLRNLDGLPDPNDVCYGQEYHWYKANYQRLRKIVSERQKLGFSTGVFHSFAAFSMDEKKATQVSFRDGAGI